MRYTCQIQYYIIGDSQECSFSNPAILYHSQKMITGTTYSSYDSLGVVCSACLDLREVQEE